MFGFQIFQIACLRYTMYFIAPHPLYSQFSTDIAATRWTNFLKTNVVNFGCLKDPDIFSYQPYFIISLLAGHLS